jgi:hypothetical protein
MKIISGLAKHTPGRHAGKGRDAQAAIGANGQRLSGLPRKSKRGFGVRRSVPKPEVPLK